MQRVYLDHCCFNRPFDDQHQDRIRLESEAVLLILQRVETGSLELVHSEVSDLELEALPDPERRRRVAVLVNAGTYRIRIGREEARRGAALQALGFGAYDALHIACAEAARADVLLTTDDGMIRRARRLQGKLFVRILNPLNWQQESISDEYADNPDG